MAPRSFWRGYLKLSLVTCPVAMLPATSESDKVRFHTLNRRTGNRIQSRYVDGVTGKVVNDDDQVKGYERGEDEYVMLEEDELDAVALESTRTIDIGMFVPRDAVEWIWYDTPHFLVPNDKVGEEAFAVIRAAMQEAKVVGLSRLVLYRRERAVLLEPRDKGIVLWTIRYGDEVRGEQPYFAAVPDEKPEPKLADLVATLIEERTRSWSPDMAGDPVQAKLLGIIKAKKKGGAKRKAPPKPAEPPTNVVSIMDALRQSLGKKPKQ